MIGLEPLAERIAKIREIAAREGGKGPPDLKAYREAAEAFAIEAGWRDKKN